MKSKQDVLKNPIFVIGVPRSGTTIISEIISVHPCLGWFSNYFNLFPTLPEISILNRILDIPIIGFYFRGQKKQGLGVLSNIRRLFPYSVEAYSIWKKNCGEKFLYEYLISQKAKKNEKKMLRIAVKKSLSWHGKNRFIAKITGPSKIGYIKSIFDDAVFIHVIRDPRAVVSSLLRVDFWLKNNGLIKPWWKTTKKQVFFSEWEKYNKNPAALAALQWVEIVTTTWNEKNMLEDHKFIEIHYEDFVNHPNKILSALLEKIGLTYSHEVEEYMEKMGKIKKSKKKFENFLNKSDIKLVESITGNIAKTAGYEF
jgi:LPS sulfotransferase NodH